MPLYRVSSTQNNTFAIPPPIGRVVGPRGSLDLVLTKSEVEEGPIAALVAAGTLTVSELANPSVPESITTDATPLVASTIQIPLSQVVQITVNVAARNTAGSEGASYVFIATYRNDAGVVTQIGTTQQVVTHEDVAGWNATFTTPLGSLARVLVTGEALKTILWEVKYSLVASL